jgi:hypothetical protein
MPHQQNPAERTLAIILICSPTNQIEDLVPRVDTILGVLDKIRAGQIVQIP